MIGLVPLIATASCANHARTKEDTQTPYDAAESTHHAINRDATYSVDTVPGDAAEATTASAEQPETNGPDVSDVNDTFVRDADVLTRSAVPPGSSSGPGPSDERPPPPVDLTPACGADGTQADS